MPAELLTQKTSELLGVEPEHIEKHYMDLAIDKKLVIKEVEQCQYIYGSAYYYMELNTAAMLRELDISYDVAEIEIQKRVKRIEQDTGMVLDELQAEAVKEAVTNGLMVITGGPGTGKTTTINTIREWIFFWEPPRDGQQSE